MGQVRRESAATTPVIGTVVMLSANFGTACASAGPSRFLISYSWARSMRAGPTCVRLAVQEREAEL